jgi:hypothetical protein
MIPKAIIDLAVAEALNGFDENNGYFSNCPLARPKYIMLRLKGFLKNTLLLVLIVHGTLLKLCTIRLTILVLLFFMR